MKYRNAPENTPVWALGPLHLNDYLNDVLWNKHGEFKPVIMHGELKDGLFCPYVKDGSLSKARYRTYNYTYFDSYTAAYQNAVRMAMEEIEKREQALKAARDDLYTGFDPDFNSYPEYGYFLVQTRTEEDGARSIRLIGRALNDTNLHPSRSTTITEYHEEWRPVTEAVKDGKFILPDLCEVVKERLGLPADEAKLWYRKKIKESSVKPVYNETVTVRASVLIARGLYATENDGLLLVEP